MFDARLALYDLNTMVSLLPLGQSFSAAIPLNDDSSINFVLPAIDTVPDGAEEIGVIDITKVYEYLYNYDVALQVSINGTWVEPPNCRFYLVSDDVDPSSAGGITFTGVSAGAFDLSGIVGLDMAQFTGKDQTRAFDNATPGTYLATMLQEAQGAGLGTALTWDFTPTHDSAGVAWPLAVSMELKPNATARDLLASLTAQGLCDWRFEGNVLRMFAPGGMMQRDKTNVELMLGREVTSGPQKRSVADMVDKVLVLGDEGYTLLRSRPSSRKRGPRAVVQSQGGVSQVATATLFADNVLDKGSQIRGELTRDISLHDECLYFPHFDYWVGDEVLAPGTAGMLEPLRIFQITLGKGSDESLVTGNALFGDRFLEFLTRQSRKISGILGGSTISGGTNAVPVPPPDVDMRTPSAPANLVADSSAYFDANGNVYAQAFFQWQPVTTATDNSALEVASYDLYARPDVPGSPWARLTSASGIATSWQPFTVSSGWRFKVQAVGTYTPTQGEFSNEVVVTMAHDATPPGVPSVPIVSTSLGVVRATWDGLAAGNMAMPIDFSRVEIAIGPSAAPVAVMGTLSASGSVTIVADAGTTQYARARAIDRTGNASAWSASVSVVVGSVLDDPSLTAVRNNGSLVVVGTIGTNHLIAGSVTTDKINTGAITADKIAAGTIDTTKLTVNAGASLDLSGNPLAGEVSTLNGTVSGIQNAVIIDSNGVTITDGNASSPHQVTISNSRLSFKADGTDVAYIDSQYRKLFITQAEVTDTLKVGFHQIQKYNTDVTLVRWVG